MGLTGLRVGRIRLEFQATERAVRLHAQRHIAALAVGLAFAGTALVGGVAGQIPPLGASLLLAGSLALVGSPLRAPGRLSLDSRNAAEAPEDLDR